MTAWLLSALDRVPPRTRRVVVVVAPPLLIGAAIAALTLGPPPGGGAPWGRPTSRAPSRQKSTHSSPRDVPPVSASELLQARGAAKRFLVMYLRFAYGPASAMVVKAVSSELHRQLVRERAQTTPAERQRHPRVVSLRVVGIMPGFVAATAAVADGGIATYPLWFTLQRSAGRWSVSSVLEG
jgi:hypothetical protein